jgi:hypothetical protein
MTAAVKPLPDHGTTARYHRGCRESCCRDAYNAHRRRRNRLRGYGTWRIEPEVDAAPVRAHIRDLMAQGLGHKRFATMSGVPLMTVKNILYGHRDGTPLKTVKLRTAEKVLAVQAPAPMDSPPRKQINVTGTRRRVQALACRGYSCTHIANDLGTHPEMVRAWLRGKYVEARWARAVADLFRRRWDTDAESSGATALAAAQTRAWAARSGFVPAAAWTDIDDPDERPEGYGCSPRSMADLIEDAEFIRATTGQDWGLIAERLGVGAKTLQRYMSGAKNRELAA